MLMKLWNEKYHLELINSLTQSVKLGIVIVNFISPLAIVYILYDFIELNILLTWLMINIVLLIMRFMINNRLILSVNNKDKRVYFYLKLMYVVSFLSTVLYGYIIWLAVLLDVPDTYIFLIGVFISGLATGAVSTLGSIFTAYLIYMIPSFLFLISALLYHGGDVFELYALSLFTIMGVFILSGYKHYIALRDTSSLDFTFKTIYENSADGVVIFKKNKVLSLNNAIVKLFKFDNEGALLDTSIRKLFPVYQPDGYASIKKMYMMVKETFIHGYIAFEWLHKDKDGKEFWCEIMLTKIHLNGSDLIHGVWRDITARKELELRTLQDKAKIESLNASLAQRVNKELKLNRAKDRQLLHQSRLAQMGEMISMIAHQWRQPLSAIASAGALINLQAQLNKLDKETVLEVSTNIANYTQHLSATIDDFRDFFKQDKEKEVTNFNILIKSVLNIIRTPLENKNIRIIEELECKESFSSYANELKQVVINLIKNAQDVLIEQQIKNPYIKIKSYKTKLQYVLEISDNGGGIAKDVMEHIFDPYFSTKLQKDGTGLGLYMSKTIVQEHCLGKLSCYNTKDGACFKIELPHA